MNTMLKPSRWSLRAVIPVLLALGFLGTGCEDDKSVDDMDALLNEHPYASEERVVRSREMEILPSQAEGNRIGQTLHFKVRGGGKPYHWRVADPSRGSLEVRNMTEAIYTVRRIGNNDIIVTGHGGLSAIAKVLGELQELEPITADPSVLPNDGEVSILTVSGGVAPYQWSVEYPSRGNLLATSGTSVSYVRNSAGDNVIRVTDGAGVTVNLRMPQP